MESREINLSLSLSLYLSLFLSLPLPYITRSCVCFLRALSHRLKESSPPLLSHCAVRTPSSTVRAKAIQLGVHQVRFRQSLAQSLIRLFRGVSFHFLSFTSMPPLRLGKAATTDRVRPSQSVGHLGFKRSNSTAPAVINNRKVPLPSCLPSLPPSLPLSLSPSLHQ